MTFAARYGETPEAEVAVKELVKGVFQLWRHFAHDRLGLTPGPCTDANTTAMLLTLENWTQMNRPLPVNILQEAEAMCASDPRITAEDRRPVVFAAIEELETTLEHSDEAGFRSALRVAATDRFTGWMPPNVFREVATGISRPYPMVARMDEVLPWWSLISEGVDVQEPA